MSNRSEGTPHETADLVFPGRSRLIPVPVSPEHGDEGQEALRGDAAADGLLEEGAYGAGAGDWDLPSDTGPVAVMHEEGKEVRTREGAGIGEDGGVGMGAREGSGIGSGEPQRGMGNSGADLKTCEL
jgi:hypothetical protein